MHTDKIRTVYEDEIKQKEMDPSALHDTVTRIRFKCFSQLGGTGGNQHLPLRLVPQLSPFQQCSSLDGSS